MALAGLF
jgi:hypothetical protein